MEVVCVFLQSQLTIGYCVFSGESCVCRVHVAPEGVLGVLMKPLLMQSHFVKDT